MELSSPKRNGRDRPTHINWFPYYAGYNARFVGEVLESLDVRPDRTVLDPWNGSGTTTTTAYRMGANAIGCDINPVMVVAAKSALLDAGAVQSLLPLANEIIKASTKVQPDVASDPLTRWYIPSSATTLRRMHFAIWRILVSPRAQPTGDEAAYSRLSTLAAFFLVALMKTARSFLGPFVGSNPTWIRDPKIPADRIRTCEASLYACFLSEVHAMSSMLTTATSAGIELPAQSPMPHLSVASSTALPFESGIVDAVVTSPPYLTRIDYAVATKPELALLGFDLGHSLTQLRQNMIGSPTVTSSCCAERHPFGPACDAFLESVRKHPSKASENYYYKLYVQYFASMSLSLAEISRLLVSGGPCVIVVQDSYYKELHADLPRFITEIANEHSLILYDRHDFHWKRSIRRVNTRSRRYRSATAAVESVLWFKNSS